MKGSSEEVAEWKSILEDEIERLREQMVGWMNRYEQMTDAARGLQARLDRVLALCDESDVFMATSRAGSSVFAEPGVLVRAVLVGDVRAAAGSPQNGEPQR